MLTITPRHGGSSKGNTAYINEPVSIISKDRNHVFNSYGLWDFRELNLVFLFTIPEELRLKNEQSSSTATEIELLTAQCRQLQEELEEARSAVTIAQCTAENDIAVEQRKCQEEIATVQQLMKGKVKLNSFAAQLVFRTLPKRCHFSNKK